MCNNNNNNNNNNTNNRIWCLITKGQLESTVQLCPLFQRVLLLRFIITDLFIVFVLDLYPSIFIDSRETGAKWWPGAKWFLQKAVVFLDHFNYLIHEILLVHERNIILHWENLIVKFYRKFFGKADGTKRNFVKVSLLFLGKINFVNVQWKKHDILMKRREALTWVR